MIRGSLPFGQWNLVAGTITALVVIASTAHAEFPNRPGPALSARPAPPMHRAADGGPGVLADIAGRVEPAVIGIVSKTGVASGTVPGHTPGLDPPDPGMRGEEEPAPGAEHQGKATGKLQAVTIGSGFFISADGYAVTNSHVVEAADVAEIRTNDGKIYSARVVGKDPFTDIALIKVDGRSDFASVKLADQLPRVGDWVLAVGNTFGLGPTVTAGIVSAREREIGKARSANGFIQIDASINRGDSGGPTFDTRGDVIGVNSMIFSPSGGSVGIAFAVPAETVRTVIPQLKDKGRVTRGWIGAEVQSVTPELADGLGADNLRGAIVTSVQDNGPAAKAGLRRGDVITSVGGSPVRDAKELTKKVQSTAPGSSTQIAMLRGGQQGSLSVKLGELPDQPGSVLTIQPDSSQPDGFAPDPR